MSGGLGRRMPRISSALSAMASARAASVAAAWAALPVKVAGERGYPASPPSSRSGTSRSSVQSSESLHCEMHINEPNGVTL